MTQTVNVVIATAALEREKESDSENKRVTLSWVLGWGGGQWFETGRGREWVSVDANGYSIGNKRKREREGEREAVSSPCRPALTPGSTVALPFCPLLFSAASPYLGHYLQFLTLFSFREVLT